jgi:hypothetical protein
LRGLWGEGREITCRSRIHKHIVHKIVSIARGQERGVCTVFRRCVESVRRGVSWHLAGETLPHFFKEPCLREGRVIEHGSRPVGVTLLLFHVEVGQATPSSVCEQHNQNCKLQVPMLPLFPSLVFSLLLFALPGSYAGSPICNGTDCDSCVAISGCGYCYNTVGSSPPTRCAPGTAAGPTDGLGCQNNDIYWYFGSCPGLCFPLCRTNVIIFPLFG